jgi:phosphoribosylanthranilate isomerase
LIVKICGITTLEDGLMAARAGADMLGVNFFPNSPRYVEPDAARDLCDALRYIARAELGVACPALVGVFVNEVVGKISITMEKVGLNFAQLSGDESVEMLRELRGIGFKGIRPRSLTEALDDAAYFGQFALTDERIPSLLVDAYHPQLYGGTGEQASAEVAITLRERSARLMLAGGLTPENVAARITSIQPWGVDVASGVEGDKPGRKDAAKVAAFVAAAKGES